MYLSLPSTLLTVPCAGCVVDLRESVSPSASVSLVTTSTVTAVSYAVFALSLFASGAVFLGSSSTVPNASLIFTRPLVATLFCKSFLTSTLSKIIALRSATVELGY